MLQVFIFLNGVFFNRHSSFHEYRMTLNSIRETILALIQGYSCMPSDF